MPQPANTARQSLQSPLTLRELLTPVFYFARQAAVAFIIPVMLAILAAGLARPVYIAQSRLLILLGSDYVFSGDANGSGSGLSFDRAQIVHAEMEILGAKDIRLEALQEIGLKRAYPRAREGPQGLSEAAEQLDKDLKVDNVPQSNVIELSLRNGDPQVAKALLDKIVELYIARRRDVFERPDAEALAPQREDLQARLAKSEADLTAFANAHAIGDYNQELQDIQGQQTALQSQLQSLDQQLAAANARVTVFGRRVQRSEPVVELLSDASRSQQLDELTRTLLDLQNRRREAAAKFQDGYPLIADLDRQIATVEAQIRAAPQGQTTLTRKGANPVYQTLDTQLASAQGDAAGLTDGRQRLEQSLTAVNKRLSEIIDIGPQYRALARDRAAIEASYQDLTKQAEDANLQTSLSRSRANVRIIQPAALQAHSHSGRLLLLAAGVVLGLAAACATVIILYALSEVMISPYDVEAKMQLPALVAVPFSRRERRAALDGAPRAERLSQNDGYFISRLLSSLSGKEGGMIELISASEGEGVTTLALDLALLVADRTQLKVLVVDIEPEPGREASTRLAQRGGLLTPIPQNDKLMRVGNTSAHVTRPLGKTGWRLTETDWVNCLDYARKHYDVVIIDAPSLDHSYTGVAVARQADLVLAVVEAEQTRAAVANNLVDRIEAVGAQVTGVVLNKRRFHIPRAIYRRL